MRAGWKDRLAYRLERYKWLHPVLFAYDGHTTHTNRPTYRNRLNNHVVVR